VTIEQESPMVIDCHVHVSAFTPGHGSMSRRLLNSMPFRFMRWKFGMVGSDERTERQVESVLVQTLEETTELDAAVILAFDAVHSKAGEMQPDRTHLYVTNDYVIELAARHRKVLFGCSVHPYRKDAVAELERCVKAGAVLCKWLPIVQDFNPADERCIPFYEALAHFRLPLLSHTGMEHTLPNLDISTADPALLSEAVRRGVTVIAAHCGTRGFPWEAEFLQSFMQMAREHERFYGDTSALNAPMRQYALPILLADPAVRGKLIHGSDWPVLAIPDPRILEFEGFIEAFDEPNWMRRDLLIKQRLGFDQAYWHRAGEILPIPPEKRVGM
jgi:predicted TIM-barrel fold metal-dependent hydrolase